MIEVPELLALDDPARATLDGLEPGERMLALGRLSREALLHPAAELELGLGGDRVRARSALGGGPAARVELALPEPPVPPAPSALRRSWRALNDRFPVLADEIAQRRLSAMMRAAAPAFRARVATERLDPVAPGAGRPAVIVGMYWLEVGGAERWALASARIVAEAGLVPILVTDQRSAHPLAAQAAALGALHLPLDDLASADADRALDALLGAFDVRGVLIHHARAVYRWLPRLAALRPDVPVIDSLHLVEWEDGGFPLLSAQHDAQITAHHVISPPLAEQLAELSGMARDRIHVATLLGVAGEVEAHRRRPFADTQTLVFVGRLVKQKRPELFIELVRRLRRSGRMPRLRAVLHGSGPAEPRIRSLVARYGLGDVIELRGSDVPVDHTFAEADCLIVTSQNEGLALTAMEGHAAGAVVISADVGAQRTLVSDALLVPRAPRRLLRDAEVAVLKLSADPAAVEAARSDQERKLEAFRDLDDATTWLRGIVSRWRIR
ncbi:glycosyltransferase [Protaetiibacter sp. SSC-01]|uniref:glycosyltransferase n=1 Tax=Protaetiibacter sp. SSC-01 TaxID=2759943 RepID=UPI001656D20C|nr:glycosyltransferase [Protaetiibacter sp. SSC-01]QNO37043.1 glycosyltransferase [Protaetiibacter sp. SSC-01]